MTHDTEHFRRRAAAARAAAFSKDQPERAEMAGELALAFAALARRRAFAAESAAATEEMPPTEIDQPA